MRALVSAALCAAALVAVRPALSQTVAAGSIRGSVYDKDFDAPLAGVRVTVIEARVSGTTTDDGNFLIERVPPGMYTLSFAKEGYDRLIYPGVVVTGGRLAEVRVELAAEVVELDEMVVTGSDLLAGTEMLVLEVRADSANLQDAISSEMIGKAGVSDVAGALKLVVGASITAGKYATVRGLSDRYTGTTLNGVRVPSADPRRRAVQVDLFPTGTLESVTVTKTFTPDLQGDFTGGGVDIRTKSVPDERFLKVSLSTDYFSDATGNDNFLTYRGGGVSATGVAGGDRDLPSVATAPLPPVPRFSSKPTAEDQAASQTYDAVTRAFQPVMGVSHDAPGPGYGFSIVGGNRHDLDAKRILGWIGALTYTRRQDFYENGINDSGGVSGAGSGIQILKVRDDSKGTDEVLIGGLASGVLQIDDDQEIAVRLVANQSAEDEARYQVQDNGYPFVEQNQALAYTERTLASLQFQGKHGLIDADDGGDGPFSRGMTLDWSAAGNYTRQYQPDVRYFRNALNVESLVANPPANSTDPQRTRRIWRDVDEKNGQLAVNTTVPFAQWTESEGYLKVGAYRDVTKRDYAQDSFYYTFPRQFGSNSNPAKQFNVGLAGFQAESPDQLWTDVFLDSYRIGLATNGAPAPNQLLWIIQQLGTDVDYTGDQDIAAVYAMAELPLHPRVKLIGGARWELTDLSIVPTSVLGTVETIEVQPSGDRAVVAVPQEEARADINERGLLPSIGAVWEIVPAMNLRASWSRTLARPTFRELAPVATEEFLDGDEFVGNPALTLSSITNYDLRWEWFRRPGEVLAVSAFDKKLTDPIELISFGAGGRSFVQPVNYERGTLRGYELEARVPFGGIASVLSGLTLGVNYTFLDSEVEVPAEEQANLVELGLAQPTRRLQGQPGYVFNASATYDYERTGTSVALFYNRVGETLLSGAARGVDQGVPDVFEGVTSLLDFTASQKLKRGFTISLRARNLLEAERRTFYRLPGGEEATKTLRSTGRDFRIAASWNW